MAAQRTSFCSPGYAGASTTGGTTSAPTAAGAGC